MNNVSLIGNLVRDIELKYTNSGIACGKFTIAVNRRFKKEGQQDTDFLNCIVWNKSAEIMAQYLAKGSKVGINGRIETGSYDNKEGKKVYTTNIVVENFYFLSSKNASANSPQSNAHINSQDFTQVQNNDDIPF